MHTNTKRTLFGGSVLALAAPFVVAAQTTVSDVLDQVLGFLNTAAAIVIALAVVYFLWGVTQYIMKAGDEEAQKGARDTMIWGIIAIFVMVSVWGLVNLLQNTFGVQQDGAQTLPQIQQ